MQKNLTEIYPTEGESKKDFLSRFMKSMADEYPNVKQRFAIANSYWERRKIQEDATDNSWQGYFTDKKTGFPTIDQYLDPKEKDYMLKKYNREGKVVYMAPKQYLQMVADMFGTPYSRQYLVGTEESSQQYFDEIVSQGKKLWMPYISMKDGKQEGRHRSVWAMEHGLDVIPVLVISVADEKEEREREKHTQEQDIRRILRNALNKSLEYKYTKFPRAKAIDELKAEIIWQLTNLIGEDVLEDEVVLKKFSPDEYSVVWEGVEEPFYKDSIQYKDAEKLDDEIV